MNQFARLIIFLLFTFSTSHLFGQQQLFDGVSLDGWYVPEVEGAGEVTVADNTLIISAGERFSGITWLGDFPENNYEITLEAKRVEGEDFFCAMTFPVNDEFCTLVLGGWSGYVTGISNINGYDAVNNQTGDATIFRQNRWYPVRLRVTDDEIEAWIENYQIVDLKLEGIRLSIRMEVRPNLPFGFATWKTTGALRNIELTTLEE